MLLILLYLPLRSYFQHLYSNSVSVIAEFSISNLTWFWDTDWKWLHLHLAILDHNLSKQLASCCVATRLKHSGGVGMSWGDPSWWDLQGGICIAMASQCTSYYCKSKPGWRILQTPPLLADQSVQDCFSSMPWTHQLVCRTVHNQLFAELFQSLTDLEGTGNTIASMEFAKGTHTLSSHSSQQD